MNNITNQGANENENNLKEYRNVQEIDKQRNNTQEANVQGAPQEEGANVKWVSQEKDEDEQGMSIIETNDE